MMIVPVYQEVSATNHLNQSNKLKFAQSYRVLCLYLVTCPRQCGILFEILTMEHW